MYYPKPPEIVIQPGWTPLPPFPPDGIHQPFLAGDDDRMRVAFFRRESDQHVVGHAWFGPKAQGPPACAHGGSIAAVLDEAMGACCWMSGHQVLAGRLTTQYRARLPLGTDAIVHAWIEQIEGRKVFARSHLMDEQGNLFAEADGLFIELKPEQFSEIIEKAHRPSWQGPGA